MSFIFLRNRAIGGAAFSPASLFASGEEGAWYEPSTTTAFLSTTDLTPCGVGDSCGFLLDKSQGAGYSGGSFTGLGSELVTNGTFDTDISGWTSSGGTFQYESGVVGRSSTGTQDYFSQNIQTTAGKTYLISVEVNNFILAPAIRVPSNGSVLDYSITSTGLLEVLFTATASSHDVGIYAVFADIEFDNISVRELPGYHATQGTAAARPLLQSGTPAFLRDDTVDDALNWSAPTDTDYTIARLNSAGTVTILTGQSLSGATDIFLEQDIAAYLAVNRALTSGETTGLTAYLEALT